MPRRCGKHPGAWPSRCKRLDGDRLAHTARQDNHLAGFSFWPTAVQQFYSIPARIVVWPGGTKRRKKDGITPKRAELAPKRHQTALLVRNQRRGRDSNPRYA